MYAVHRSRLWRLPWTVLGKASVALVGVFSVIAIYMGLLVADGQRGGDTYFDNMVLAIPALLMMGSGVLALLSALIAVWWRGERSILVHGALVFGGLVTAFVIGELAISL